MKNYLILIIALLFPLQILAQPSASLTGQVTDEQGQPLEGVNVGLEDTAMGAATNEDGRFKIKDIPAGTYTLVATSVGYKRWETSVTLQSAKTLTFEIRLKETTTALDEVVVKGISEGKELELTAQTVEALELSESKLKTADLGEVMAQTKGVNVQRAGGLGSNTRFSLNGLSGDKVRFFYNGIPLNFTPYAFGIANVPVNMIQRVDIYKGVVPVQFGADALGGAVNLVPPGNYYGLGGSTSYQVGSFGTHRVTGNINYAQNTTGVFVTAGGFYDYTDNDYKIDVAIPNERGQLQPETVRRFHDGYSANGANLRIGVRNKPWANELSLESYYGDYNNEVQNSQSPGLIDQPSLDIEKAVAGNPFGEVRFTSRSEGLNLRYNVNSAEKWALDLKTGYNYNERASIDTSRCLYNWRGECIRENNEAGEFGDANHLITTGKSVFARQQLTYTLSDKQTLKLSAAPTYSQRTSDDLLVEGAFDPARDDGYLFDLVTGLEYTADLLDERLQSITFVKHYRQNIRIESFDPSVDQKLVDKRSVSNYGAGSGLRYDWSPRFSTKISYEYAYRLPRQDEIFGNGQLIAENLELRPESSHNMNLQWNIQSKDNAPTDWQLQGSFFLRQIDDLIFLLVNQDDFGSYQNVWSATSRGIELSGRWTGLVPGLTLSANTTYQQYRNTSDSGPFASFKGNRLPNTPYFFANGAAQYQLRNLLSSNDNFSVFWNARYVHSFFIGWENTGLQEFKAEVPGQTVQTAGMTYRTRLAAVPSAFTLEVQNLTNAKVFDFYGVQRPGRAFYLKSTIQF